MTEENQTYEGEGVQVTVESKPGCRVFFDIAMQPEKTKAEYRKAVKTVAKEASLPGFRKGKAPDSLVTKRYGPHVERQWRDEVLNSGFQEALRLTGIEPLHKELIEQPEIRKISLEEESSFLIKFEKAPSIPEIDTSSISLARPEKPAFNKEEEDKRIQELRYYHTDWKEVTDRPAKGGDFVDLDIISLEEPSFAICRDTRFELAEGKVPLWLRELVIGLKPGESAEGISERDPLHAPTQDEDEESFKPTKCRVALRSIKQGQLPEMDDELAKKAGVESIEKLRERIREAIERDAESFVQEELHKQLKEQLIALAPIDLPHTILDAETSLRLRNKQMSAESAPASKEELDQEAKAQEKEALEEATEFLQLFYLTRPIIEKEKLGVQMQEVLRELSYQMTLPLEKRAIDASQESEQLRFKLFAIVSTRQALDKLLEKIEVKEA